VNKFSFDPQQKQKALNYAFLLLKFRLRSEKELYERLRKKKFDERIIRNALSFLKEKGFINDNYFAKAWIEWRIKKPLGIRKIKEELKLKGIDKEIIDSQIRKIKEIYREEDIVSKLAGLRISKLKGVEPYKAKQRVYAYLIRRGFSPDIVMDVVSQL
jgi:regulatory protein